MSSDYPTEPEPEVEAPQSGGGETPVQQATTSRTKDYLGRALVTPGTNGKDFLGRLILAGDKDYMARALVA